MLTFECPSCKAKLQAAEANAGKKIRCPKCQQTANVPTPEEDVPTEAITEAPVELPAEEPTAVTTPENAKKGKKRRSRDDDDDDDDDRPRRRRDKADSSDAPVKAAAGISVAVIVVCALGVGGCCVVAVLAALLVPAVSKVREAATRTQSTNNLKQIGLATHSFHDMHKRFPFNGSNFSPAKGPGGKGKNDLKYSANAVPASPTSGSWGFQISPFMDQIPMFQAADRNVGVAAFMCPGRGRPSLEAGGGAWSDYFYNNYLNDPMQAANPAAPDMQRTLVGITDGTSNTILYGHGNIDTNQYALSAGVAFSTNVLTGGTTGTMRSGNAGASSPGGVTLRRDGPVAPGIGSWGGPFPQGALMSMGDATVRMFPYSMGNLNQFLTPTGNEVVVLPDF